MIRRTSVQAVPGPILRTGAAVAVALVLATGITGCTMSAAGATADVSAIYEHAEGLSPDRAMEQQRRDAALFAWASERGLAEEFTRAELESAYADATDSSVVASSGARNQSLWEFYRDYVEQQSQLIRDDIGRDLTIDEVRRFYDQHPEAFDRQDVLTIEVTEWEGPQAVHTRMIEINETTVRSLQEADDDVIAAALVLNEGEQVVVERGDGRSAQVRCVRRADAGIVPFVEVVQAAASQLTAQMFDAALTQRAHGSAALP